MEFMAKIPRVEITDQALKVLKIEAALSGLPQKEALEDLILRGASSRTLELVAITPALDKVEDMEEKPVIPKKEVKPAPERGSVTNEARSALAYILAELEAGREPTSREAAEKVGLTPTGLGMMLSKAGIKAQNTRRDLKAVKIYTKPMIARIKELLGTN